MVFERPTKGPLTDPNTPLERKPVMDTQMKGKVVLVTGASSGIGRATAVAFAQEGATVIVSDVDVDGGEATVAQIQNLGGRAAFVKADVSRAADVKALIDGIVSQFGRLDYAFNNAGIEGTQAMTVETTEENWDRVLGVDLNGTFLCMKV